MTEEEIADLRKLLDDIVAVVGESTVPLPPRRLYEHFRKEKVSEGRVRAAMWYLVDGNRLKFTTNRSLILPNFVSTTGG